MSTLPDETQAKRKPVGEPITREQRKMLQDMFEENGKGDKKYTLTDIAAAVGLSEPTIIKYHKRWEGSRRQEQDLKRTVFQRDPLDSLEEYLSRMPGFGDDKLAFIIDSLRTNPARASNPQAVYQYLIEIGRLSTFVAAEALAAMFPGQAPPQLGGPLQNPYGMPQQQQGPWGYGAPYGAPPQPYAPGWPPPPPYGYPYPPPYPQQQGLTKEDVRGMLDEALGRNDPPATEYEEIEEPILDKNGNPIMRPDGNPLIRTIRRPIGTGATTPALSPIETLRQTAAALREIAPPPPPPAPPPAPPENKEERQMLIEIQKELAGERARREVVEKYNAKLDVMDQTLRAAELKAAVAGAGLPPESQILMKGIDAGDKHLDKLIQNQDKRMARVEGLLSKLITPQPGGVPMPVDESEIARLEARQRELDAQAQAPAAPPAAAPAPVAPVPAPQPPAEPPPVRMAHEFRPDPAPPAPTAPGASGEPEP